MNPELLNHYRAALEAQLADLRSATREHEAQLDDRRTADDFTGPDRASDLESLEVDARVTASERKLTAKIHRALERIDLGTDGLCEACGSAIPTARLDAKPSVSLCLRCQEAHEAHEAA
jgi:DnaK suppressor protein